MKIESMSFVYHSYLTYWNPLRLEWFIFYLFFGLTSWIPVVFLDNFIPEKKANSICVYSTLRSVDDQLIGVYISPENPLIPISKSRYVHTRLPIRTIAAVKVGIGSADSSMFSGLNEANIGGSSTILSISAWSSWTSNSSCCPLSIERSCVYLWNCRVCPFLNVVSGVKALIIPWNWHKVRSRKQKRPQGPVPLKQHRLINMIESTVGMTSQQEFDFWYHIDFSAKPFIVFNPSSVNRNRGVAARSAHAGRSCHECSFLAKFNTSSSSLCFESSSSTNGFPDPLSAEETNRNSNKVAPSSHETPLFVDSPI